MKDLQDTITKTGLQAETLKNALLAVSDLTYSGFLSDQDHVNNISKSGLAALFRLFAEYAKDIESNLSALERLSDC